MKSNPRADRSCPRSLKMACIPFLVLGGLSSLGCGTSSYESLVEARIAELKSSNSAEPLDWNLVESSFKFTFLWPGELALINQNTGEVAAEKAELNVGGLNFQANFYSSPTIQRDNLSNAQQSQLQNLGYQMELQADGTVNGIAYEELTFVKEDPVSRNRTRIFQVSADKCAVLSVTGPDLEDPQLSKFFDSIGATQ